MLRAAAATRAQVILWNIDYLLLSNGVTIHPAVCRRVFAMPDAVCAAHHKTIVSRIESSKPAKRSGGSEILRGAGGGEMSESRRARFSSAMVAAIGNGAAKGRD